MVEMACEEHDRIAAGSQFITHTIGRVLGAMEPQPSAIDTRGYEVRARGAPARPSGSARACKIGGRNASPCTAHTCVQGAMQPIGTACIPPAM